MSRRYPAATLTPVRKTLLPTFRRGPGGSTRRECWQAVSDDGVWAFERIEEPGTPWQTVHVPSGWELGRCHGTLDAARHATGSGAVWAELWADAVEHLATFPERDGMFPTPHDAARGLLSWLVEHGHGPDSALSQH